MGCCLPIEPVQYLFDPLVEVLRFGPRPVTPPIGEDTQCFLTPSTCKSAAEHQAQKAHHAEDR